MGYFQGRHVWVYNLFIVQRYLATEMNERWDAARALLTKLWISEWGHVSQEEGVPGKSIFEAST